MKNLRSSISGSCAAFGTFLFGAPVVLNATSPDFPKPVMVWCMVAGFVMQGLGIFFGHLFGADAKSLRCVEKQVESNKASIDQIKGDTTQFRKS